MVAIPTKNHGPLREAMVRVINGETIDRDELLKLARRHGQTPELFDADFATMQERFRLHAEYWASDEGQAITEAKEKLVAASQAVSAAQSDFASAAKIAHLQEHRQQAATAYGRLANANTEQFQAFARAMKATAFPDGDYMEPSNVWIH